MRVRDHIALSTAGAVLVLPRLRGGALGLWAGSVLIDADHYFWFCLRERRLSPFAAMRFFGDADPPQHAATRRLHSPAAPLAVLLLGVRRRALLPVALGMLVHIVLDHAHESRMDEARAAALKRDAFACRACGTQAADIATHLSRQPLLLPSYAAENLVALCNPCHRMAHSEGRWGPAWK